MICGFCHKEIEGEVGSLNDAAPCGRCLGGCRMIHCPHCGYANPAPSRLLSRLFKKKEKSDE